MAPKGWRTLRYSGPSIPEYRRLPSAARVECNSRPVTRLTNNAEEAIVNYSNLLMTKSKHVKNGMFNRNFFQDLQELLNPAQRRTIRNLKNLNFKPVVNHLKTLKRLNSTKSKKLERKARNDLLKAKHGFCTLNGAKVALGSWTVEPAGIFVGRPGNPQHGKIKLRIQPEDVIINCSGRCPSPAGHSWRRKLADPSAAWVANYTNNLGLTKYIFFGTESKIRSSADERKFNIARNLHSSIARIRRTYEKLIVSRHDEDRQMGLAMYFIDRFALRIGSEKGVDAADTVGCTTLRKEHVSVKSRNRILFDFKGKDSIRFLQEFKVPPSVHKAIRANISKKGKKTQVFDLLTAQNVNNYLKEMGDDLSAKVFRTFNASLIFEKEIQKVIRNTKNLSTAEKLFHYKKANLKVAKLCNHKKAVNKKLATDVERLVLIRNKKREILRAKTAMNKRARIEGNEQLMKCSENLIESETKLWLKQKGGEFSLATSQANYLDPRITVAWCKRCKVPLEKVWSSGLRKKYGWAAGTSKHFSF